MQSTSLPPLNVTAAIAFQLGTNLGGLLVAKDLITKDELRAVYNGIKNGLKPPNDAGVIQAQSLLDALIQAI